MQTPPIYINGAEVECVPLGVHISDNLTWSLNSSILIKKERQCLYFLRSLKKAHLSMDTGGLLALHH